MMIMKHLENLGNLFNSRMCLPALLHLETWIREAQRLYLNPLRHLFFGQSLWYWEMTNLSGSGSLKRKSFRHKCKKQTYIEENTWKNTSISKFFKTQDFELHTPFLSLKPALPFGFTPSRGLEVLWPTCKVENCDFCCNFAAVLHLQISSWICLNLKTNVFRVYAIPQSMFGIRLNQAVSIFDDVLTLFYTFQWIL